MGAVSVCRAPPDGEVVIGLPTSLNVMRSMSNHFASTYLPSSSIVGWTST